MASSNNQKIKTQDVKGVDLVKKKDSNILLYLETESIAESDEYNVNVAYGNEAQAVYVQQGQYVIPVGGHPVVLQDNQGDFEYIINNIVVTDEELQDATETDQQGVGQSVIYYASDFTDQSQIFEEDREDIPEATDGVEESNLEESGMHAVIPLSKRIKLEQNYIDEYQNQEGYGIENNFVQVQEEGGSDKIIVAAESDHGQLQQSQYQYAILRNGKLHLQTLDFVDASADNHVSTTEDKDQHQQLQEQLAAFQQSISMDDTSLSTSTVDLDKITGKNLITGQTVTLDSYFDKLQRRLATVDVADQAFPYNTKKQRRSDTSRDLASPKIITTESSATEGNFINKKIVVGKTSNGKKIVGKILSVRMTGGGSNTVDNDNEKKEEPKQKNLPITVSKEAGTVPVTPKEVPNIEGTALVESPQIEPTTLIDWDDMTDEPEEEGELPQVLQPHIIIKKHIISRENFDYNVGKTLAGLMGLESVQRRLQNKNLVVKLVEKIYDHNTNAFNKTVSYVYGHMELIQMEKEGSDVQRWVFVLQNESRSSFSTGSSENANEDVSGSAEAGGVNPEISVIDTNNKEKNSKRQCTSDNDEIDDNEDGEEIKDISLEMSDDVLVKYNETASLSIIVTIDKTGKKSTRVNLSPQQPESRCPVCSKEFKTPLQMRKHLNNVHLTEKTVKCETCGKNFANQTVLLRHQRIHTEERWYQCQKCSKSFNTAGGLKRHVTVHDPSLRPLECSVCLQRFTDESSLRKHLLIHTGIRAYACEVCNRAFVNQGDLNFHRRIHDPIKQFSCEVCGREFSRHSNLMRHAEIHRGVGALHRCDICGCSYSFVSSLTRHIVQKHIGQQQ